MNVVHFNTFQTHGCSDVEKDLYRHNLQEPDWQWLMWLHVQREADLHLFWSSSECISLWSCLVMVSADRICLLDEWNHVQDHQLLMPVSKASRWFSPSSSLPQTLWCSWSLPLCIQKGCIHLGGQKGVIFRHTFFHQLNFHSAGNIYSCRCWVENVLYVLSRSKQLPVPVFTWCLTSSSLYAPLNCHCAHPSLLRQQRRAPSGPDSVCRIEDICMVHWLSQQDHGRCCVHFCH